MVTASRCSRWSRRLDACQVSISKSKSRRDGPAILNGSWRESSGCAQRWAGGLVSTTFLSSLPTRSDGSAYSRRVEPIEHRPSIGTRILLDWLGCSRGERRRHWHLVRTGETGGQDRLEIFAALSDAHSFMSINREGGTAC